MAGSTAGSLVNSGVSASGEVPTLLIEKFNGKVNEQYLKGENLQAYFEMREVVGTNTISNKYIGETDLQVMTAGKEALGTEVEYDKNALTVDTSVIARNIVAQLHDVQSDIDGNKSMIAKNQVKQIKKLEDEMIIQQLLLGVLSNTQAIRTTPRVKGHGFSISVTISDAQAGDPNSLLAAIEYAVEQQLQQEVEVNDLVCLLPWTEFQVLRDAERITNGDYETASGTSISGYVLKSFNIPVVPTNRFPTVAHSGDDHHLLSANSNGYRYDVTTAMTDAKAVLFQADALLLGRTITLQGDIFWDRKTKSFFIDSWFAEGAIPDRWESVSAVFGAGSENTTVKARAVRKATPTVVVTA